MVKIMIVDDELFVRMGLKVALDWEKHGFVLIGEASNGVQALELMKHEVADIVITDIKMPEMDGIGLIRELSAAYPEVACLVLSNYDEFGLVKEAMKMGAADYLLKVTVEANVLLETLQQISGKLDKKAVKPVSARKTDFGTEPLSLSASSLSGKKLLADLIAHGCSPEYAASRLKEIGLGANSAAGFVVLLTVRDYDKLLETRFDGDADQLDAVVMQLADGLIRHQWTGRTLRWSGSSFLLLIADNVESADAIANNLAERVQIALKDYLDIESNLVYGISYIGYDQLQDTLSELESVRLTVFYEPSGTIRRIGDIAFATDGIDQAYGKLKSRLSISLYQQNREWMDTAWREFAAFARGRLLDPVLVKNYFVSAAGWIQETLLTISEKAMMTWRFDLAKLHECATADEFEQLCVKLGDECDRTLVLIGGDRQREEILKIVAYIRQNLNAKITLEDMARYVAMNKSYLSRLFKKEMGKAFQDYLADVRMEKAGELLLSTDRKIADIAEDVGYGDIFYFNRVFKNHYKMSPSEYKKRASIHDMP